MQPAHGKSQSASDSLGTQSEGTTFDPVPYRAAIDLVQIHGADYLLNTHELRGDEWIADIGCGEGYVLQKRILPALHTGRIIEIDISAEMLSHARITIKDPRVNFAWVRGEEIPRILKLRAALDKLIGAPEGSVARSHGGAEAGGKRSSPISLVRAPSRSF
ncbi:MAG: Methyltransferase domain [Pseudomonadota bacterium]|jgi:SAM-dependent methyltransferase